MPRTLELRMRTKNNMRYPSFQVLDDSIGVPQGRDLNLKPTLKTLSKNSLVTIGTFIRELDLAEKY